MTFERTGEVTYVPAVDPVLQDVGMPGKLVWEGQTGYLQYYNDPVVIDRTVSSVTDWFIHHLHKVDDE